MLSRVSLKPKRALALIAASLLSLNAAPSQAATSAGCDGGGFTLLGLSGEQHGAVPAASVPGTFLVKGRYVEFTVDAATFGVLDWTLTGATSAFDLTGGKRTVVYASKMPDHRGLALNGDVQIDSSGESIVITRTGPGLTMKIQAKDCSTGGVFQMEVARADGTATVVTHVLGDGVFYFDNPNVRDHLGERLPCSGVLPDGTMVECNGANADGTVTVTARVNFATDASPDLVGRDSPQVATRIATGCPNNIPNPAHPGSVNHCGAISRWSVASGGRMGQVMGEDATEIAPAATACVLNCTAQNQVNGRAVVVGFPSPVPDFVRLQPRFPQASNGQLFALTLSPTTVTGGSATQGSVSLAAGAAAGGVVVSLKSSNPSLAGVPSSVAIPAGAVEATFPVATASVGSASAVTLNALAGNVQRSARLTLNPPAAAASDSVTVTRVEYVVSKRQLHIEATSTNASATMSAFVTSTGATIGRLTNVGGGNYRADFSYPTNPGNVTVTSSGGGSGSRAVVPK
jgi:hypothetical protein